MNEDYVAPPEVVEAVKEASISIACCLDEVEDVTKEDLEESNWIIEVRADKSSIGRLEQFQTDLDPSEI